MVKKIFLLFLLIPLTLSACSQASPQAATQSTPQAATQATPQAAPQSTPQTEVTSSATQAGENSGYPAPGYGPASGYPALAITQPAASGSGSDNDHYVYATMTAFRSLPAAQELAKQWKPNASLIQISRLRQMETNLALAKGPLGWFYNFMDLTDGSSVELYVEVVDGAATGKTEVQQLFTDNKAPYKLLPIDISKLLDSDQAFQIFLDHSGKDYVKGKGRVEIEFQLVQLEDMENPVWSIYDTADPAAPPLANIDAVTGALVDDPFAFLRK